MMNRVHHIIVLLVLILGMQSQVVSQDIDSLYRGLDTIEIDRNRAITYEQIALEYMYRDFDSARHYLDMSIALVDSLEEPVWYADYYNNIGIIENSIGNFEKSFDGFVKANTIYAALGDDEGVVVTNHNIGGIYELLNMDDKALELYNETLIYYRENDDNDGISGIQNNIGEIYYGNQEYDLALTQYLQALEYAQKLDDNSSTAIPLHNIGRTYQKLGDYSKGVDYLNQSLEINTRIEDLEGLAYDYYELGEVYKSFMNYALAEKNYLSSLEYARDLSIKTVIADNLGALGELYRQMGQYEEALDYQQSYAAFKDSVFNEEKVESMTKMQFGFEIEKKEKQIELLKLQNESTVLRNEQNNIFLILTIIAMGLLGVVAFILVKQNNLKKIANDQLRELNEKVYEQNNNLTHYNERLKYSQTQLSELNATKDKFFSIISHDLRSPLNSLSGLLQILMKNTEVFTIEELIQYGQKINESVINLTNLLENLLQWSNAQMGKVEFSPDKLNIYDEVSFIIGLYQIAIEQKKIEVSLDFDKSMTVLADKNMFNFIIRNLLSNALKFTMKQGKVCIGATTEENDIKIYIEDNGVGISKENIQKLFAINHHYTTLGTEKEKGTGLGLLLINEFVKKHSGTITVKSELEKGTRFEIFFPRI